MCIEYHIYVNMYHVSAQGVDERMINVRYYYYRSEGQCGLIEIFREEKCLEFAFEGRESGLMS